MPRRPPTSVILVAAVVLLVVCALVVILGGNRQGASGEKPAFNPSYAPDTQPNSPTGHQASLIERASILMDREEFAEAESDLSAL